MQSQAVNHLSENAGVAVEIWSSIYRQKSQYYEYATLLYGVKKAGTCWYFTGKTLKGCKASKFFRANVVRPFLYLYFFERLAMWFFHRARIEAFIHTHPAPPSGYTYREHSPEDLMLLKFPGIQSVYVVPYEDDSINRACR